jgi:spermidine synthase
LHVLNGDLTKRINEVGQAYYNITAEELEEFITFHEKESVFDDQERVVEVLQTIVRDWSTTGLHEREKEVETLTKTVKTLLPAVSKSKPARVLVPGAGLGRLGHEIASIKNVDVVTNEVSGYMRLAYHFLQTLTQKDAEKFFPWLDWWVFQISREKLMQEVQFPDALLDNSHVTLREGDFLEEFKEDADSFDAVVTFFFMDTARNILEYMDTIYQVLRDGGVWVNMGPLLYYDASVELSLGDLVKVAEDYGFEFLDVDESWGPLTIEDGKTRGRVTSYVVQEDSLRLNQYKTQFFAARLKKYDEKTAHDEL